MKNKKRKDKLFYFVLFIFFLSFILFLISLNNPVLDKKEIYASLTLSDTSGFDANSSALTFGSIIPGGSSSSRSFNIENNYDFPVKASIKSEGDISEFLYFEKTYFLGINETKNIGISAIAFPDAEYGNYSGKIIISLKKDI